MSQTENSVSHTLNLLGSRVLRLLTASFPTSALRRFVFYSVVSLPFAPRVSGSVIYDTNPRGTREPLGNQPNPIAVPTNTLLCEQVRATCIYQRTISPTGSSKQLVRVVKLQVPTSLGSLCARVSGKRSTPATLVHERVDTATVLNVGQVLTRISKN